MADISNALLGAASGLLGLGILHASWSGWLDPKWIAVPCGWAAVVLLSVYFWARFAGPELGIAYAALMVSLLAWMFVAMSVEVRKPEERRRPARTGGHIPSAATLARGVLRFIVAIPVAGAASVLASIAASSALPWKEVDRIALVIFVMPALWGVAAVWAAADSRILRPAVALAACAVAGAGMVFL